MTERIVDTLESIKIDIEQRQLRVPSRISDAPLEVFSERRPIGKSREIVVHGLPTQLLMQILALDRRDRHRALDEISVLIYFGIRPTDPFEQGRPLRCVGRFVRAEAEAPKLSLKESMGAADIVDGTVHAQISSMMVSVIVWLCSSLAPYDGEISPYE